MICPKCNKEMIKRRSKFGKNFWWGCSNFPMCKITCAENLDGSLMSTPADEITKNLRKIVHSLCAKVWGQWDSAWFDKKGMYAWLKKNTKTGHIGKMDRKELKELITKLLNPRKL